MEDLPPHIWCRGKGNRGIGTFVTLANIIHTSAASRKVCKALNNKECYLQWLQANVMEKNDWVYIDDLPDPIYNGRIGQFAGMILCEEEKIKLCWVDIGGKPTPKKNGSIEILSTSNAPLTKKIVLPVKNLYKINTTLPTACMRSDAKIVFQHESTKLCNTPDNVLPWTSQRNLHGNYATNSTGLQLEAHKIEQGSGMNFFQFNSERHHSCSEPLLCTDNGARFMPKQLTESASIQIASGSNSPSIHIDNMRLIWNHLLSSASRPYQMNVTPWLIDRLSHDVPVQPKCVLHIHKNADSSRSNANTKSEQHNDVLDCDKVDHTALMEQSLQIIPSGLHQLEVRSRFDQVGHESTWTLRDNGSSQDTVGHVVGNTSWNNVDLPGTWDPFI